MEAKHLTELAKDFVNEIEKAEARLKKIEPGGSVCKEMMIKTEIISFETALHKTNMRLINMGASPVFTPEQQKHFNKFAKTSD